MILLTLSTFFVFAMNEENQTNLRTNIHKNIIMERDLENNLEQPLKNASRDILADIEESKSEKDRRIERLSRLKKTCCLGSCMIGYNKLMSCFWHVTEPCLETIGVLSLGAAFCLVLLIPHLDPSSQTYFATGAAIAGGLGGVLLKTGSKFAKELEARHEENVLALLQDEH